MSDYNKIPAIDDTNAFAPQVREQIAAAPEMEAKYAHLDEDDNLVIDEVPVDLDPSPVAGLDTVGWLRGVFINEGDTIPVGTPAYTVVVEIPA